MRRAAGFSARTPDFFALYTRGLTGDEIHRLFTHDARDAYRYFARGIDTSVLDGLPVYRRVLAWIRLFFLAFSLRLSPARRALFGVGLAAALLGLLELFDGFATVGLPLAGPFFRVAVPVPTWVDGTMWLVIGFLCTQLLVLLEVADRLSLKGDLNVAREIQLAMLPHGTYRSERVAAHGRTRPANTVGGDFYDIQTLADGTLAIAVGDVAGKGSPASLLMALLLAVLHTLMNEGLAPASLVQRLNAHVVRHAPGSRFITLFFAVYDPTTGQIAYVNAGHPPALVRRHDGSYERLRCGGMALGMFEGASYETGHATLAPGDRLVSFSDGITEAEDPAGQPFDEQGVAATLDAHPDAEPERLGELLLAAVVDHTQERRMADDLTVLVLERPADTA